MTRPKIKQDAPIFGKQNGVVGSGSTGCRHDLMTWVTVQTNDIGDTFLGIYALERSFGVGGAGAICLRVQGKKGVVRVVVSLVWDQPQERLQMAQALLCGGSQGIGGRFASASLLRKSASRFLARTFASSAQSASTLGPKEAATAAARAALQRGVECGFQRVVSHRRWPTLRTAYGARCAQSLCVGGDTFAQSKRGGGAPGTLADFSPLRFAQSAAHRQRSAFWRQGSIGDVAFERVVVASGHCGGVYSPGASPRQRRARTDASGFEGRYRRSASSDLQGTEATDRGLERLVQCRASSRSVGPGSAGAFLSAESSSDATTAQKGEVSAWVESAAGVQSRLHQMAGASAFCRTRLCGPAGGTQGNRQRQPRSLPRTTIDRLALLAGSGGDATRLYCPSDLMLCACPPPESNRAAWERAPEQTAAPPSSCWLVCSGALQAAQVQKCYPCH